MEARKDVAMKATEGSSQQPPGFLVPTPPVKLEVQEISQISQIREGAQQASSISALF